MRSVLLEQLQTRHGLPLLDADNFDHFVYGNDTVLLFFSNDPVQFPESNDVAVILPELLKTFSGRMQAGVISKAIERELQARYHFTSWPALVFLRGGEYLGVVTGIKNWQEYIVEIGQVLAAEVSSPPGFDLEKVCKAGH
ncbi:MAG: hydrogenase [Methylococcaceae bacterium]|jgi:hydrogenase-1 operon protein HyaE